MRHTGNKRSRFTGNDITQTVTFKSIATVPSFELWLPLHLENIQAPLHRDQVIHRLKQYIPGYGASSAFAITGMLLEAAMQRSQRLALRFIAYTDHEFYRYRRTGGAIDCASSADAEILLLRSGRARDAD